MKKTLLETVVKGMLEPYHLTKVALIDAEDFSGVEREVRKMFKKQGINVSQDFLDSGVLALKQYYLIPVIDPKNMHAISDSADPFWHAHILHTKQYTKFCNTVFGEYIHHEPLDHAIESDVKDVRRLYNYTRAVIGTYFSFVDENFYPTNMPDVRLICTHYRIREKEMYDNGLLDVNEELADIAKRQEEKLYA
jgi:hypothetical protein